MVTCAEEREENLKSNRFALLQLGLNLHLMSLPF
jgi:hypothetical protein